MPKRTVPDPPHVKPDEVVYTLELRLSVEELQDIDVLGNLEEALDTLRRYASAEIIGVNPEFIRIPSPRFGGR
jgi:hypothetical protein